MLEILSTSPFLSSLSLTLLHFLWQGFLVAAVLKSTLLIFNNHKPQLRYALSALAVSVNLLLPIITFAVIYQTESSPVNIIAKSLALSEFIQELKQPDAFFSYNELTTLLPSLLPYIAIFWLATISLLAVKLLLDVYNVNNLTQQNTIAPSQKLQARFNELAKQIQLTITPRLLISLNVEVPMAIGWFKPVVLLPASMVSGLTASQLEMLLLHELAHIRRHDYLVNFFQTLVEILLFFHPAVHWVSKQMRNEREYCSDDIAVQHCGDAIAYAHTLADTASLCNKTHHHTIPNMAMAASGGDLKQRVIRLVDHHCAPKNNISKWFASVTIIFSVLLLSSKQLLTMPLLDIWYHEKSSQYSKNITQVEKVRPQIDKVRLNSAIIQRYLPPQANKVNIATTINLNAFVESDNNLTHQQQMNTQKTISSMAQLTVLPVKISQSERSNKELTSSKYSIIKQEITRTNANIQPSLLAKSSEKKMTKLAILPQTKTVKTEQIKTLTKNIHPVLIADSSKVDSKKHNLHYTDNKTENGAKLIDHVARQKEEWVQPIITENKSIVPLTPVWHSAERVKSVVPIYPSIAKRKGIEIEVKVNFTIDIDGQIKDIKFSEQKKINYFKKSIRTAIKKWRYLPAKVDEKPVESQMAKVFAFSLQS